MKYEAIQLAILVLQGYDGEPGSADEDRAAVATVIDHLLTELDKRNVLALQRDLKKAGISASTAMIREKLNQPVGSMKPEGVALISS